MIVIKEANMGTREGEVIKCTEECKKTGESKFDPRGLTRLLNFVAPSNFVPFYPYVGN